MKPKQRVLSILRRKRRGLVFDVERWIPKPGFPGRGFRRDFAGIADVLFFGDDGSVLFVQACTHDASTHKRKLLGDWTLHVNRVRGTDEARARKAAQLVLNRVCRFLRQGHAIEIWAFTMKNQRRPGAPKRPHLRVTPISLEEALEAAQGRDELPFAEPALPAESYDVDLSRRRTV